MCVHTCLHPSGWVCVCVPVHLCGRGRSQEMASAVFLFDSLPYLGGQKLSQGLGATIYLDRVTSNPKGSLVSDPAYNATMPGFSVGAGAWTRASCLQFGHRLSPVLTLFLTQNYCYLQSYLHWLLLTIIYYKNELNLQPFEFHSLHIVLVHVLNP